MMGQEYSKENNDVIGIVKATDWHDLDDINQCGWCFDYNEYKDDLYIVWFPKYSFESVEDSVKEYTLLEINDMTEPVQIYNKGNLPSIKYIIENRKEICNSISDDYERNEVNKYFKKLNRAYKYQKEFGLDAI